MLEEHEARVTNWHGRLARGSALGTAIAKEITGGTPVPRYRTRQPHHIMRILQGSLRARKVGWMADLKTLKGVEEKDRKLIEDAEAIVGPEPSKMGFVKNLFWGN